MKNLLFLLFLSFVCFTWSCKNESKPTISSGNATVEGTISGIENQMVFVKQEDPLITKIDTILVNQDGKFSFSTVLDKPKYFTFEIDGEFLTLYFRPHDKIKFTASHKHFFDQIRLDGSSSVYNNYLIDFFKSEQIFQNDLIFLYQKDEKFVSRVLDSIKDAQQRKFESLKNSFSNIDEYFQKFETKRIDFEWGYRKITYPLYHKYYTKNQELNLPPDYNSFLNILDVNDSTALILKSFRNFVDAYYYSNVTESISEKLSYNQMIKARFESMQKFFKSSALVDYLSFDIVKSTVLSNGLRDVDEISMYFDTLCKNPIYKTYINKQYEKWNHLRKGQIAKDFTFVSSRGDSVKLSDFRGKYIFIDVWATWCKPCLEQLPFLNSLQEKYKKNKIVFISISVDQDKKAWQKMLKDKQMLGIQLYSGRSDMLYNYYLITGIPRFILIDKEGKFVESSCRLPSGGAESILSSLEGI